MAKDAKGWNEGYWTQTEARRALDAWEASGLSVRAFALREGLLPQRLYRWAKHLGRRPESRGPRGPVARFVPAVVKVATVVERAPRARVVVRCGARAVMELADASAVSPAWVAAVMAELERASCS